MTRMLIRTAVVLAVVSAVPTAARLAGQEKDAKPAAPAGQTAERAEDVEVLRHLLNRACGVPRYQSLGFGGGGFGGHTGFGGGGFGGGGFGGGGFGGGFHPNQGFGGGGFGGGQVVQVDTFDGVYLPGHGAVFTLKVPATNRAVAFPPAAASGMAETCLACHAVGTVTVAAAATDPPPAADWDRVRNDLRGSKPTPAPPTVPAGKASAVCDPGRVTEAVLRTLAANGRRVRHLPATEAVTVVVSYEGFPTRAAGPAADADEIGFSPDEAKQIAIADLHLRQGNAAEAAAAYRRALARTGLGPVKVSDARLAALTARPGAVDELKAAVADVRRKLAHALIAAGDLKAAKEALDAALATTVEAAGTGSPKAVPVPAKLVIAATKAHLDAADKLDPAAFRKGVKVESAGLPAADAGKK